MRDKKELLLKRCDLSACEGMCCYDGVYISDDEERKIKETVSANKDFFSFLPEEFIIDGDWRNLLKGRKTALRSHRYKNTNYPQHFKHTRCVFSLPDARCSLQVLAESLGKHPWFYKPKSCWLHPLRKNVTGIMSPPANPSDDPQNIGKDYPGYSSYTECGRHKPDGEPWFKVLLEEIIYYNKTKS